MSEDYYGSGHTVLTKESFTSLASCQRVVTPLGLLAIVGMVLITRYVSPNLLRDLNPWPDTVEYVLSARNLAEHGKFAISINGQYLPSRYSVGFPLLIVPTFFILGNNYTNAILSVLALDVVSVLLVYWIGTLVFSRLAGFSAALLLAISPADRTIAQIIASDVPATTFILLALVPLVTLEAPSSDKCKRFGILPFRTCSRILVAGLLFGYCCWIRQIDVIYLPVFALLLGLTYYPGRGGPSSSTGYLVVALFLFVIGWSLLQAPLLLYNFRTFGSIMRTGYNLWAPYWYDDLRRTFSLSYAFGPNAQALEYLKDIIGISSPHPDSNGVQLLYSPVTPIGALLSVVFAALGSKTVTAGRADPNSPLVSYQRAPGGAVVPVRWRFIIISLGMVFVTVGIYATYFFYARRFLHLCIPLMSLLAGGSVSMLSQQLLRLARHRVGVISALGAAIIAAILVIHEATGEIGDSVWWQTHILGRNLDNQAASDYLDLVAEATSPNAVVVSDYPPVLFSALERGSQRKIIPLSAGIQLGDLLSLPSFRERPDIVERIVDQGKPVYFIGDPTLFLGSQRGTETRLALTPEAWRKIGPRQAIVYRVLPERWSFIAMLRSATVVPPTGDVPPVGIRSLDIDNVTREAILEHPDSRIVFPNIQVPPGSSLRFFTGIDPTCSTLSAGATFAIEIDGGGGPTRVFSRTMRPLIDNRDRGWIDNRVGLSQWAGQHVDVHFITRAVEGNYTCAWAEWGDPVIEPSTSREEIG